MKTRTWLRSLALAGAAALAVTGVGTSAAQATPPPGSCPSYRDCGDVGGHITRNSVITRATMWLSPQQEYHQEVEYAYNGTGQNSSHKWRRDCSGFVSMAWRLPGKSPNFGLATGSLYTVSQEIGFRELEPGDILNDPNGGPGYGPHVMIFAGWVGSVGGDFSVIEENPAYGGAIRHRASVLTYLQSGGIKGRPGDAGDNFVPRRYNKITDR